MAVIAPELGSFSRRSKGRIAALCNPYGNAENGRKDQQDRPVLGPVHEEIENLLGTRIHPLGIFENHHDHLSLGEPYELVDEDGNGLVFQSLRRQLPAACSNTPYYKS